MEKNSGQNDTTGTYTPSRSARIKRWWPLAAVFAVLAIAGVTLNTDNPVTRSIASAQEDVRNATEEINTAKQNVWTDFHNKHFCQQKVLWSGMTVDATVSDDLKVVRIEMDGWSVTYRQMNNGWVDRTNVWKKLGGGNAERSTLISHMPPIVEDCQR